MRLEYDPNDSKGRHWYAATDDGGYDGAGVTPLDAVCDLVTALERAIAEHDS